MTQSNEKPIENHKRKAEDFGNPQKTSEEREVPTTADYIEGKTDPLGRQTLEIYTQTNEYVVYRIKTGVKTYTHDEHLPPDERVEYNRYLKISPALGLIDALHAEHARCH